MKEILICEFCQSNRECLTHANTYSSVRRHIIFILVWTQSISVLLVHTTRQRLHHLLCGDDERRTRTTFYLSRMTRLVYKMKLNHKNIFVKSIMNTEEMCVLSSLSMSPSPLSSHLSLTHSQHFLARLFSPAHPFAFALNFELYCLKIVSNQSLYLHIYVEIIEYRLVCVLSVVFKLRLYAAMMGYMKYYIFVVDI